MDHFKDSIDLGKLKAEILDLHNLRHPNELSSLDCFYHAIDYFCKIKNTYNCKVLSPNL